MIADYKVNREKGVTVGKVLKDSCTTVREEVMKKASDDTYHAVKSVLMQSFNIDDIDCDDYRIFKAVSRAQEDDVFDEKTGKLIVDAKLSYKYHKLMQKKYGQLMRTFRKAIDELSELERKHYVATIKCDEKLKKFL